MEYCRTLCTLLLLPWMAISSLFTPPLSAHSSELPSAEALVDHYANIVLATYEDTLIATEALEVAIQRFIQEPTDTNLRQAQFHWKAAREFYGQTEAFRFYGGPIDRNKDHERQINGWPLDASMIDWVIDDPHAGIVQNPNIPITKEQLMALNATTGDDNICTGWHAIEFMLWGQDIYTDSGGRRPISDYTEHPFAERRKQYLSVVTQLLVEDLQALRDAWKPNHPNYRKEFMRHPESSLRNILIGLNTLSRHELATERLEVILVSQDHETEHSQFSDNTHRDIINNTQSIANVWFGTYTTIDGRHLKGTCLNGALQKINPVLAKQIESTLRTSIMNASEIQPPFDQEILSPDGRARIQTTIDGLIVQSELLQQAAETLGLGEIP